MDPGVVRDTFTLLAGAATGALSGLFGVGGASFSTPAIRALGASAAVAVGTTLPSIIPGAASGAARYHRAGLVDWRAVRWCAPIGIVAAVGGSVLSKVVPGQGHVLMLMTAALLAVSAWRMWWAGRQPSPAVAAVESAHLPLVETDVEMAPAAGANERQHATPLMLSAVGLVAGLLSGLLGVGGGIVMVPAFTQIVKMPIKPAIATSLACVAIYAVPGTITHGLLGDIDWRIALLLTVGVVPGARLGSAAALRFDEQRLRVIVAIFLGLTAVAYAAGEISALV